MREAPKRGLIYRDATYEMLDKDLFKLTLTEENKAEIFEYGLSKLEKSQQEASKILGNLDRWYPATRANFSRRSTSTILDTPFRLVYPNADLAAFDETGLYVRQYMAVSYCWRSKDFLPDGYERHGSWPLSKPFVDAIIAEKNHPRVGIWMDQLCIDQKSSIDKQKSISAMDIIYRCCLRLLVLLEDVHLDQNEIELFRKYDPRDTPYDPAFRPMALEQAAIDRLQSKIMAARWWQRAWCFHEFSVNEPWTDKRQRNEIHNATFVMNGPQRTTISVKWWTLHNVMGLASTSNAPGMEILVPAHSYKDREADWRSSLMARHNGVSSKGCLLLHDKLSIMINMCGVGLAYQGPSLRSPDEVLFIGALFALAAGEGHPLTLFDGRATPRLLDSPSWLQRNLTGDDLFVPKFKPGDMKGIHRVSMQAIELDMLFLPTPAAWTGVTDADLSPTHKIFPHIIPTTRPATHGPVQESFVTASRTDKDLDIPRRRFLAGCIKNGYSFTARLWKQLEQDVVGPNYNQGYMKDLAPNLSLRSAAQELLAQLLPVSALLNIPSPSIFTVEDAHLFITWLTDPRSVYYISVYTYSILCTDSGEQAFSTHVAANENFSSGPVEELKAAIPIDLLSLDCMRLKVWLLRPAKTDSEDGPTRWRVVGKTLLLGEPDLRQEADRSMGGQDAVVKIRRAIVGG